MTKQELIDILKDYPSYKEKDLKAMKKYELEELYNELEAGEELMHPNERDYDAEDEDGI